MDHTLKTWPEQFQETSVGRKPFEWRKNDRDYQVGDYLHLHEYEPREKRWTGRHIIAEVTYILHGGEFDVPVGYCVMAIKVVDKNV